MSLVRERLEGEDGAEDLLGEDLRAFRCVGEERGAVVEPTEVLVLAARRMAVPPQAFLPMRNDGGVGLMSGRGLY